MPADPVLTLFGMPAEEINEASGEDLRMQVHQHLMQHRMLTAFEIARAPHLPHPGGAGQSKVRRQLLIMEDDGEAEQVAGTRAAGDKRAAVRWVAT